jgi:hypothetical protein
MPAPRAALTAGPFALIVFVACRVSTQQNELHEGDQISEAAEVSRPASRMASAELDASEPIADAGSDADVDADAGIPVPPPCGHVTMNANAPKTTCGQDSYAPSGGTLPLGGFNLAQWADQQKNCTNYTSQRQGTMFIEQVGSKLFMRWTLSINGSSSWGTYELTRTSASSFVRTEVCSGPPQSPGVVVDYGVRTTVGGDEITFVHANGQERWTRIPKVQPQEPEPVDPIFNSN